MQRVWVTMASAIQPTLSGGSNAKDLYDHNPYIVPTLGHVMHIG